MPGCARTTQNPTRSLAFAFNPSHILPATGKRFPILPAGKVIVPESGSTPQWIAANWNYRHYELYVPHWLEPGRYALVLTKAPEDPLENYHALLPSFKAEGDGREYIATRLLPDGKWKKQDNVMAFGVFGFVP